MWLLMRRKMIDLCFDMKQSHVQSGAEHEW